MLLISWASVLLTAGIAWYDHHTHQQSLKKE